MLLNFLSHNFPTEENQKHCAPATEFSRSVTKTIVPYITKIFYESVHRYTLTIFPFSELQQSQLHILRMRDHSISPEMLRSHCVCTLLQRSLVQFLRMLFCSKSARTIRDHSISPEMLRSFLRRFRGRLCCKIISAQFVIVYFCCFST